MIGAAEELLIIYRDRDSRTKLLHTSRTRAKRDRGDRSRYEILRVRGIKFRTNVNGDNNSVCANRDNRPRNDRRDKSRVNNNRATI